MPPTVRRDARDVKVFGTGQLSEATDWAAR
jgi:hypothetical protein